MCDPYDSFNCIATRSKVHWRTQLDDHVWIQDEFKLNDQKHLLSIYMTPDKGFMYPECNWRLRFKTEDNRPPSWWNEKHEQRCYAALDEWKKKVYSKINLNEVRNPIHPFKLPMVKKVTEEQKKLLSEWDSDIRLSGGEVGSWVSNSLTSVFGPGFNNNVTESIWRLMENSVRNPIITVLKKSVHRDESEIYLFKKAIERGYMSIWNVFCAYTGSFFKLKREQWRVVNEIKTKKYPFESVVKLWKMGLVPSFDGKTWRLHTGPKAKVVYEISAEELRKMKR